MVTQVQMRQLDLRHRGRSELFREDVHSTRPHFDRSGACGPCGVVSRPWRASPKPPQTDLAPLDQAGDHANVFQDRLWPRWIFLRQRCGSHWNWNRHLPSFGILLPLLLLAILVLVVSGAALAGLTLAMSLPTSKRTAQVPTPDIPWVGEKKDPTVPTSSPTPAQLRLCSNNRSQQHVVDEDQSDYRATPIPSRRELKMLPDRDCKKPRTWLWTLK